jgi:hypothetical protein
MAGNYCDQHGTIERALGRIESNIEHHSEVLARLVAAQEETNRLIAQGRGSWGVFRAAGAYVLALVAGIVGGVISAFARARIGS